MSSTSLVHGLGVKANEFQEFSEDLMAGLDVLSHLPSSRREREPAIAFIVDEATLGQPPHHIGNSPGAETERGSQIRDAGIPLLLDQFLNPLQMILCGLGPAHGCFLRLSSCS